MSTPDTLPRRIKPLPQRRSRTVYTATIPIPGFLARDPLARLNITTSPPPGTGPLPADVQHHLPIRDLIQGFGGFLAGLTGAGANVPPELREALNALSNASANGNGPGEELVGAVAAYLARHLSTTPPIGPGGMLNVDLRAPFPAPPPPPPPPQQQPPPPPTPRERDRDRERDADSESDEDTHLSQPGNTKKRKVPGLTTHALHNASPNGVDVSSPSAIQRMSKITLAGLHHKDLLKSRKRQLTAVLGKDLEGRRDDEDLDIERIVEAWGPFPLETNINVDSVAKGKLAAASVRTRQSKRDSVRRSRGSNKENANGDVKRKKSAAPKGEFTFEYESEASSRLRATTNQVYTLRSRFETELAKQSSLKREKDKEREKENAKDKERGRKRNRAAPPSVPPTPEKKAPPPSANRLVTASPAPPPPLSNASSINSSTGGGGGGGKKKKKKRSALANASNPHHLRNYVPSRLPHQGPAHSQSNANQDDWALPLAFLRAGCKGEDSGGGEGEWICAFCEYELLYGDESDLKRAVRKRKAILRRRKRARERARGVTSGSSRAIKPKQEEQLQDDEVEGEEYDDEEEYEEDDHDNGQVGVGINDDGGGGGGGTVRSVVKG